MRNEGPVGPAGTDALCDEAVFYEDARFSGGCLRHRWLYADAILKECILADGAVGERGCRLDPIAEPDLDPRFPADFGIGEAISLADAF